jgi:anti-sigma B factor antagonist
MNREPQTRRRVLGLQVRRVDAGPSTLLVVSGKIDVVRCRQLGSAIDEALNDAPLRLVVDLCDAEIADATGLAVLLRARAFALRRGVQLKLVCDSPSTLKALALAGV